MHRQVGMLNYLSNSNLDYNNAMNMRRFGAYAGVAIQPNPKSLAGLVVDEMGGIVEEAQEKPMLYAGIALLAYPHAIKAVSKKVKGAKKLQVSAKNQKTMMIAGLGAIAFHFIKPMLAGE